METTTSPLRPTLGGLISTFVSPLPPPLLLLFLSSALRSLSLKMVTPQSLFTLFGMFNLYYSICISLSVNPVLFASVMSWALCSSISACFFQALLYLIGDCRVKSYFSVYFKRVVSLGDVLFWSVCLLMRTKTPQSFMCCPNFKPTHEDQAWFMVFRVKAISQIFHSDRSPFQHCTEKKICSLIWLPVYPIYNLFVFFFGVFFFFVFLFWSSLQFILTIGQHLPNDLWSLNVYLWLSWILNGASLYVPK